MLVYVKPVPIRDVIKNSPYGTHKWVTQNGVKVERNKFGKCDTKIRALYDPKLGGYANKISYTPWIDSNGVQVVDANGTPLTLQDKIEQEWGLPKGYLTNKPSPRRESPNEERNLTYYERTYWALGDSTTVLDTNTLDGLLGYYVLLESKYVANSEKELKEFKWPKAKFYIYLENEEDTEKYRKNLIKSRAFAKLESDELTPEIKRKMVSILNLASSTAHLTSEQVHNLLYDFIEKSDYVSPSNIDKFNALFLELGDIRGKERFEAKYLLRRAIDNRLVYEKSDTYVLMRPKGNIEIGSTYDEAVDFLCNPKKSAIIDEILEKLK